MTVYENKKTLHPQQGRRVLSAVPPSLLWVQNVFCATITLIAITGPPVDDYIASPSKPLVGENRRVQPFLMAFPFDAVEGLSPRSPFSLTGRSTTPVLTFELYSFIIAQEQPVLLIALKSGPRGIRTLDLLNAIETRSQLRHGPIILFASSEHRLSLSTVHCLVDLRGFEPLTFSVRLRRAPNCATGPFTRRSVFYCTHYGMSRICFLHIIQRVIFLFVRMEFKIC